MAELTRQDLLVHIFHTRGAELVAAAAHAISHPGRREKLVIAGSYATSMVWREEHGSYLPWIPGDIDLWFCSGGLMSTEGFRDRVEGIRQRLRREFRGRGYSFEMVEREGASVITIKGHNEYGQEFPKIQCIRHGWAQSGKDVVRCFDFDVARVYLEYSYERGCFGSPICSDKTRSAICKRLATQVCYSKLPSNNEARSVKERLMNYMEKGFHVGYCAAGKEEPRLSPWKAEVAYYRGAEDEGVVLSGWGHYDGYAGPGVNFLCCGLSSMNIGGY